MTNARLEHVAPGLVAHIRTASPEAQHRIALAAARRAVADAGLDDPLVDAVLATGSADAVMRDHLRQRAEYLDEVAFAVQEDVAEGQASPRDYEVAWAHARAATAVVVAFADDALVGALDAVYEAWHAVDDTAGLVRVVENLGEEH